MVFNATFKHISVISWQLVLLVEETIVPRENLPQVTDKLRSLYHIIWYQVHLPCIGFKLTTLVVIGTDCTGSCNPITIRSRPRWPLVDRNVRKSPCRYTVNKTSDLSYCLMQYLIFKITFFFSPQTLREGADMKDIKSLEKVEKFLKLCHRDIVAKCFG